MHKRIIQAAHPAPAIRDAAGPAAIGSLEADSGGGSAKG